MVGRTLRYALLGSLLLVLLAELALRVLPVSSATRVGYYIDPRIPTYAPHLDGRYATGWDLRRAQPLRTNNLGFVSAHDFARDPRAVALIGDSYVESASLPAADRPDAQLEHALGGTRPVYAMGSAGTALLDYAERIRYGDEQLGIRDFVIVMERGDVRQALCDSGNVHSQCLDPHTLAPRTLTVAEPSLAKRVLRQSALAQYLVSQLQVTPARLWRQALQASRPPETHAPRAPGPVASDDATAESLRVVDAVAAAFFERVRPHVAGRLVIVLDADRPALAHGRAADDPARRRFVALARAAGVRVIDTEPIFRDHYARSPLSLDNGPDDGHLNVLGVRLVAEAAAQALARREPATPDGASP